MGTPKTPIARGWAHGGACTAGAGSRSTTTLWGERSESHTSNQLCSALVAQDRRLKMSNCKHVSLRSWKFEVNGEPAGMWSCVDCGHKFVPLDLPQEKDAERYRKWRTDYTAAVANHGDGSCVTEMLLALADAWTPEDVDAAIDAAPAVGAA